MTMNRGIEWAEEFVASQNDVYAAIIRGNELWLLTLGETPEWITECYLFFRHGEPVEAGIQEVQRTDEGTIYLGYAWLDSMGCMLPENKETREALESAHHKLEMYTDPAERRQKVLELLRWSYLASTGFSFDEENGI